MLKVPTREELLKSLPVRGMGLYRSPQMEKELVFSGLQRPEFHLQRCGAERSKVHALRPLPRRQSPQLLFFQPHDSAQPTLRVPRGSLGVCEAFLLKEKQQISTDKIQGLCIIRHQAPKSAVMCAYCTSSELECSVASSSLGRGGRASVSHFRYCHWALWNPGSASALRM